MMCFFQFLNHWMSCQKSSKKSSPKMFIFFTLVCSFVVPFHSKKHMCCVQFVGHLLGTSSQDDDMHESAPKKPKKTRKPKGKFNHETGVYVNLDPKQSSWYLNYCVSNAADLDERSKKEFRRRFRMPRCQVIALCNRAVEENWFPTREKPDACGKVGVPLMLLILGCLRYLGRGVTFDDIAESINTSTATIQTFFHEFIEVCSSVLYPQYVKIPTTDEQFNACRRPFEEAGIPAFFSTDGIHIVIE